MNLKELKPSHISLCVIAIILVVANLFAFSIISNNSDPTGIIATSDSQTGDDTTPSVLSSTDVAVSSSDTGETTSTTEQREEVVLELPYMITVDKVGQIVTVYTTNEEGKYEKLVRQMICSTGQNIDKLPDGVYPLKANRKEWCDMLSRTDTYLFAQYTTQITGSFLFHSVPYTLNGDKSSLSESRYAELGQAVSGGCIRLTVEGAKWIYDNCPAGTPVVVFKGEKYDAELVESLRPGEPVDGWDPTDPDPNNPNYRPLITTPDPEPDKYAPLYDYQWQWAKEQERITYSKTTTSDDTTDTTEATDDGGEFPVDPEPEATTTAAPETTTAAPATTTTTAATAAPAQE